MIPAQEDHPRTGAEDRTTLPAELDHPIGKVVPFEALRNRRALAAGKDQAVEADQVTGFAHLQAHRPDRCKMFQV